MSMRSLYYNSSSSVAKGDMGTPLNTSDVNKVTGYKIKAKASRPKPWVAGPRPRAARL